MMRQVKLMAAVFALVSGALLAGGAVASMDCNSTFPVAIEGVPHEMVFKKGEIDFILHRLDGKKRVQVHPLPGTDAMRNDQKHKRDVKLMESHVARVAAERGIAMPADPCTGIYGFTLHKGGKATADVVKLPKLAQITIIGGKATADVITLRPLPKEQKK